MSEIRVLGTTNRGTAVVDDLVFGGPDDFDVEAYLVRPAELGDHPPRPRRIAPGLGS